MVLSPSLAPSRTGSSSRGHVKRDPLGAPESEQVRVSLGLTLAPESSEFV